MRPLTLAVVGSRRFANPKAEDIATGLIWYWITKLQPAVVVSGGADGVDTWARDVAELCGMTTDNGRFVERLPENRSWKPDGYEARNRTVATECTHLLCIRCEHAGTYGSGWTADEAERLGREAVRRTIARVIRHGPGGNCHCAEEPDVLVDVELDTPRRRIGFKPREGSS